MDQQIDRLFKLCGDQNRYQYFTLVLTFFLWINTCFMSVSIPLVEKPPLITYINTDNVNITEPLTYDICDKYDFTILSAPHSSWVLDFGIYCDRTKTGLIGSFTFAGFASGALFFPVITKYLTYKPTILLSLVIFSILGLICTIVRDYYWIIMSLMVFHGMFSNFCSYSSLVAVEEIASAEKRVVFGNIVNIGFSSSGIVFVGLFYFLNNWIYVYYCTIGMILFMGLLFLLFTYDAPRGFIMKGNPTKTLEILRGIAKFNNRLEEFDEKIKEPEYVKTLKAIEECNSITECNKKDAIIKEKSDEVNDDLINQSLKAALKEDVEKITAFSLLKYRSVRTKFFALCFLFLFTNSIYSGISISAKNLPGQFYMNLILLFALEALSFYITGLLTNIPALGRKKTLLGLYILSILCMLFLVFIQIPDKYQLIPFLVARFCIAGLYTTFHTYSLENYPTPLRTLGFGINTTFGNIGGIISPMIIEHISQKVLFLGFAGVMVIDCLVLMIFLKETVGLPMPETIEEINDLTQIRISTNNNTKTDSEYVN